MAKKARARKTKTISERPSSPAEASPADTAANPLARSAKKKRVARGKRKATSRRRVGRGVKAPKVAKATRRNYSPAERQRILAAARREKLTGAQVAKRFGISAITYYVWKKKSGAGPRRKTRMVATGRAIGTTLGRSVNLVDAIRHEVRAHIGRLLPDILKSEVGRAIGGSSRRRR